MDKLKMQQWVNLVDDTIPAAKHKDMARDTTIPCVRNNIAQFAG